MNQYGKEYIIDFDQLYDSMAKCRKNVMWKPSVKSFVLNDIENLSRMEKKLKDGTWKNGEPKPIQITYPKKREGLSISFKDRIYQRSINDNALYPATTSTFIKDNWACQTGRGPDIARNRIKEMLWDFFLHYGLDGYVVHTDIQKYYQSMRHKETEDLFKKYIDPEVHKMVCDVLNTQYKGDTGYNPGSQMVQIAGITALNEIDHFIKEKLHVRYYGRYMDDSAFFFHRREDAERNLEIIEQKLNKNGFKLNEKKTIIAPISEPFLFLGFYFRMTETGKAIMILDPKNVKHERKKLKKMVAKSKHGEITKEKVDECYRSWKNHAEKGNSYKLLKRMDRYYKGLWRDDNADTEAQEASDPPAERNGEHDG